MDLNDLKVALIAQIVATEDPNVLHALRSVLQLRPSSVQLPAPPSVGQGQRTNERTDSEVLPGSDLEDLQREIDDLFNA